MKLGTCKCFECPLPDCVFPCPIRNNKNKQSYDGKKEKMKAYQRAYYLKNKEKLRVYKKAYYLKTKIKDMTSPHSGWNAYGRLSES